MRNELLQERASRQDLECDKMALERQVHTLLSGGKQLHTVFPYKLTTKHQLISFMCPLIILIDCIHSHTSSKFTSLMHWCDHVINKHQQFLSSWPLQNKDLKSRVSHLEGSQKSNKEGLVSQLEERVQELEQRLEGEERWDQGSTWGQRWGVLGFKWWRREALGERLSEK